MQRLPEPELMDTAEQARAYAGADFSAAHQGMVTAFRQRFAGWDPGPVQLPVRGLDLGCGPADVTLRFARAFPQVHWLGVDGSEAMLAEGRRTVEAAGLAAAINLELRLLPDLSLPQHAFDVVICNSLLHHLSDPAVLWQAVRHCARPGAPVLVMDLRRPPDEAAARALAARHAAEAPAVLARDFYNSLRAAYTAAEARLQLEAAGMAGFHAEDLDELHLLVWGRF